MNSQTLSIPALALATIGLLLTLQLRRNQRRDENLRAVTASPLEKAYATLSSKSSQKLIYTPDFLPGGRNVSTPYGQCRAFEFGPENGPKVLLIHGISTPCISVAYLARQLVKKGCRVLLFDLYGRGFSDNPTYHPHSAQLYTSQILSVLASSPLPWAGDNAFALIGYSLGGGIAAAFTDCFPNLVKSLVLICPAGLVRDKNVTAQRYIAFQSEGIVPTSVFRALMRRRVNTQQMSLNKPAAEKSEITGDIAGEIPSSDTGNAGNATISLVLESVKWQIENHNGFVDAFTSSVRHAPISGQHAAWKRIGVRLSHQRVNQGKEEFQRNGFYGNKLILVLGRDDAIILSAEVGPDVNATVREENVHTVTFNTGHDLPVVIPETLADQLWDIWIDFGVVKQP
jgi:pimeloyl-ACP methyl ester carboxylesterase